MDIASISGLLSSVTSATQIAKFIKDSGASLEQAEIKLQLADLITALADTKLEIAGIQQALIEKDKIINELNRKLEISENVIWQPPYYMVQKDDGTDGPYCQNCYDSEGILIRLQMPGAQGYWLCNKCEKGVKDSSYKSEPYIPVRRSPRRNW